MSNDSERLDGDVLGEKIGDDGLPGVGDYPPDTARGVNDPNLAAPDDVAMRAARERSEPDDAADGAAAGSAPDRVADLLPPDGDCDRRDDVQQELGTDVDESDAAPVPAEVDAVRVRPD